MEDKEFDKYLKKAITNEERIVQKNYLRSLELSLSESEKTSGKFYWKIAASIVLIIGLSISLFLFNQSPSTDQIYKRYYAAYENVVVPIVRNEIKTSKKAKVFANYEQGNYKNALLGLNQLTTKDSLSSLTISFYKANSHLYLGNYKKAKELFLEIITKNQKSWYRESKWYLALIAIKQNDKEIAISYLLDLQKEDKNAYKSKEVEKLIHELKN